MAARNPNLRQLNPKLDPRFDHLLSLPPGELEALHNREVHDLGTIEELIFDAQADRDNAPDAVQPTLELEIERLRGRLFRPLTAGVEFEPGTGEARFFVFIDSHATAQELEALGARVRTQSGQVFTASIREGALRKLLGSPKNMASIGYMELDQVLLPDLNLAIPYAGINTLHTPPAAMVAVPKVQGAGVVVGVIDVHLDIYHPGFRTAGGKTRVLHLWDQTLTPGAGEASPPVGAALPGFGPAAGPGAGASYGVEYDAAAIDREFGHAAGTAAYATVRHPDPSETMDPHGTAVTGCAAGNGRDLVPRSAPGAHVTTVTLNIGAAPEADIIFVRPKSFTGTNLLLNSSFVADAFRYIFARAAHPAPGKACVVNLSYSTDVGPHDGTTPMEVFLDRVLATPGRAITLSAGNENGQKIHATGMVSPTAGRKTLQIQFNAIANPNVSDTIDLWYDAADVFEVTVTPPAGDGSPSIGPVASGSSANATLSGGVKVTVSSAVGTSSGQGNHIQILFDVAAGMSIPVGVWRIDLAGPTVNGKFHAWADRNNRGAWAWVSPDLLDSEFTLSAPGTAKRPIAVGNHDRAALPPSAPGPSIANNSGRGSTRDGRVKPEIAAMGQFIHAPEARKQDDSASMSLPAYRVAGFSGTSYSAPIVTGACALLFECRGKALTCADLRRILAYSASPVPNAAGMTPVEVNAFGFGFLQMAGTCAAPLPAVDLWIKKGAADIGAEPYAGALPMQPPDITVAPNPVHDPSKTFTTTIRVTVNNRGTTDARNTVVYLHWSAAESPLAFPGDWKTHGIFASTGVPLRLCNWKVIPLLAAGASTTETFFWSPPVPGNYCLLVRMENEADPSLVAAGGSAVITARNNLARRDVVVT